VKRSEAAMPLSFGPESALALLAAAEGARPWVYPGVQRKAAAASRSRELSLGPKREGEGEGPGCTRGNPLGDLGSGGLPMSG